MQFKIIFIGLVLAFQYFQPTTVYARQTEIPFLAPIYTKLELIKEPKIPVLGKLDLAPLHFDPMGTHDSSYVLGQCTWGAASMKGNVPNWGNANTWDDGARAAGIAISDKPVIGAIAQTDRGYYGHVAVDTGIAPNGNGIITEMNYDGRGIGSVRTREAAPGEFVYIELP